MRLIAKTLYGLENILADELIELGAKKVNQVNRAVLFEGDQQLLYKANYCLRSALSVLLQISEFGIRSSDDLYNKSIRITWEDYIDNHNTFSVAPVVKSNYFNHTGYAGLRLKDAIVDRLRQKTGKRPSVDTRDPDFIFNLHINKDMVTISLDSSVIPLYKRGYRKEQGSAPINEVLAAGIILISGWDKKALFIDPMCGSGTIPIEAALIASNTAPGKFRKYYGFQKWKDYDEDQFILVKKEADAMIKIPQIMIHASDVSETAINITRKNVVSAGFSDLILIRNENFKNMKPAADEGVLIMNPPYGQRIRSSEYDDLYGMVGTILKHNFPGFKAWIITADKDSLKKIGLKPAMKTTLYNGPLECILVKYEMYQGSKKSNNTISL